MAGYKEHISVSGFLGVLFGVGTVFSGGFSVVHGALAAALSWVAGMLPDLDSGSGRPIRELFSLSAALAPLLLLKRLLAWSGDVETAALLIVLLYVLVRYGGAWMVGRIAVHRGMFHSVPALLIAAVCQAAGLYRPRDPQTSDLWRLLDEHFDPFQQVYDERFAAKYGYWRPVVERSVEAFLKCGDLQEGFARVRCPKCKHEMFVAYSCKQRCTCPSCHQKRTLLTAIHVAEEVCFPVAHRQVVLTLPKRLRPHTRPVR